MTCFIHLWKNRRDFVSKDGTKKVIKQVGTVTIGERTALVIHEGKRRLRGLGVYNAPNCFGFGKKYIWEVVGGTYLLLKREMFCGAPHSRRTWIVFIQVAGSRGSAWFLQSFLFDTYAFSWFSILRTQVLFNRVVRAMCISQIREIIFEHKPVFNRTSKVISTTEKRVKWRKLGVYWFVVSIAIVTPVCLRWKGKNNRELITRRSL